MDMFLARAVDTAGSGSRDASGNGFWSGGRGRWRRWHIREWAWNVSNPHSLQHTDAASGHAGRADDFDHGTRAQDLQRRCDHGAGDGLEGTPEAGIRAGRCQRGNRAACEVRTPPSEVRYCVIREFSHWYSHVFLLFYTKEFSNLLVLLTNRADSISESPLPPPPPPEILVEEVKATEEVSEQVYLSEGDAASLASVDR